MVGHSIQWLVSPMRAPSYDAARQRRLDCSAAAQATAPTRTLEVGVAAAGVPTVEGGDADERAPVDHDA